MEFFDDIRRFLRGQDQRTAHLKEIYDRIKSIRRDLSKPENKRKLRSNVEATLEACSSDSHKLGKPNRPKYDFFGKQSEKRDGMWFLRDSPAEILQLGRKYSKKELGENEVFDTNDLGKESVYYSKKPTLTVLFADLETPGDRTRNHFFDKDRFHWDSRASQHNDIAKSDALLFCRIHQQTENKPQPYIYCGMLKYLEHEKGTSSLVHIVYKSSDYTDEGFEDSEIRKIWNVKSNAPSSERTRESTDLNETERESLITSRVGQGEYRREVLCVWDYRCAVTGSAISEILIASHIVPWRDPDKRGRQDKYNGILLSRNIDALFDRYLISFTDEGRILISDTLDKAELKKLGINETLVLSKVHKDMIKYLKKHRTVFREKQKRLKPKRV